MLHCRHWIEGRVTMWQPLPWQNYHHNLILDNSNSAAVNGFLSFRLWHYFEKKNNLRQYCD